MKALTNYLFKHHIVRYIISGGTGAVVNLGSLFVLKEYVGLHYLLAGIIAFALAVFVSFILQKKWTFRDHSTEDTHKQFMTFLAIAILNLIANTFLLYLFTGVCHIYYIFGQILASGIVAVWSYFIYKLIFKRQENVPVI